MIAGNILLLTMFFAVGQLSAALSRNRNELGSRSIEKTNVTIDGAKMRNSTRRRLLLEQAPDTQLRIKTWPFQGLGGVRWGWEAGLRRQKKWIVLGCGSVAGNRDDAKREALSKIGVGDTRFRLLQT